MDENSISFVDVFLAISKLKNVDLYVTGSNFKLLSKNILTQFRDKATNIHLYPLSFKEYYDYLNGDKYERFYNYMIYGGMPLSVLKNNNFEKEKYLKELFKTTYINDVIEYNKFKKNEFLDELCDIISFSTGQLLNTQKISNIFKSRKKENIGKETIDKYIKSFEEAYIISEAKIYDIKGNSTIGSTRKYYF